MQFPNDRFFPPRLSQQFGTPAKLATTLTAPRSEYMFLQNGKAAVSGDHSPVRADHRDFIEARLGVPKAMFWVSGPPWRENNKVSLRTGLLWTAQQCCRAESDR